MYLHIDQTTGNVVKYSPVLPKVPGHIAATVPPELELQLRDGNTTALKQYFVLMHADGRLTVEPNNAVITMANKKLASTELTEIKHEPNADFRIVINNVDNTLQFTLSRIFNIDAHCFMDATMTEKLNKCIIYFTKKNDPTYLLFYMNVPLEELLKAPDNTLSYPLPVPCNTVSVYTKPILNSYSVETI